MHSVLFYLDNMIENQWSKLLLGYDKVFPPHRGACALPPTTDQKTARKKAGSRRVPNKVQHLGQPLARKQADRWHSGPWPQDSNTKECQL